MKKIMVNLSVYFGIAAFGVACSEVQSPEKESISTESEAIQYEFYDDMGEAHTADSESIYTFIENICSQYVNIRWQGGNKFFMEPEYRIYRKWLCIADSLENILDPVSDHTFYKTISMEFTNPFYNNCETYCNGMTHIIEFTNFNDALYGDVDNTKITFSKFSDYKKVEELSHRAALAYLNTALYLIYGMHKNIRCNAYEADGDEYFDDGETDTSTYFLLEEAYATLPNLIEKIWSLKADLAEKLLNMGAEAADEWKRDDIGRIPALRQLMGSVNADIAGSWQSYEIPSLNLVYPAAMNIPKYSNDIIGTIGFINKFFPDFLSVDTENIDVGTNEFYNEIKSIILQNANLYKTNVLKEEEYLNISDLYNDYYTSSFAVTNTIDYMYAHMFMFPRVVDSEQSGTSTLYEQTFDAKYTRLPWFYFTKVLPQNTYDDDILLLNDPDYSGEWSDLFGSSALSIEYIVNIPKEVGLSAMMNQFNGYLNTIYNNFEVMTDPYNQCVGIGGFQQGVDNDRAIALENKTKTVLEDAKNEMYKKIGTSRLKIVADPLDGSGNYTYFKIYIDNCSYLKKKFGVIGDEENLSVRIYSIDDYKKSDDLSPIVCSKFNQDNEYCNNLRQNLKTGVFGTPDSDDICEVSFDGIHSDQSAVIELQNQNIEEESKWVPVYILSVAENIMDVRIDIGLLEGDLVQMVQRVLAYDDKELNEGECSPAAGLEGECLDRDWVPAIDNETIDTTGNQYEESYKHYLDVARVAANQTRTLREELMSDIITEAHEVTVEQAQEDSAVDAYYNNISEVCGYDIAVEKEKVEDVIHASDDQGTLKTRLEDLWNLDDPDAVLEGEQRPGEYGCAAKGESRFGTVQCSVKRNCEIENANTVREILPTRKIEEISEIAGDIINFIKNENNDLESISVDDIYDKIAFIANIPSIGETDFYDKAFSEIDRIEKNLNDKEQLQYTTITSMKIYQWPELYQWENYNSDQSVYGAYFEKLNEIDVIRSDLSSAISSYFNGYDRARVGLEKIRNTLEILRNQYDYEEGVADAQALLQTISTALERDQYETSFTQPWKNCVNDVNKKYSEITGSATDHSVDNIENALKGINEQFRNNKVPEEYWINNRDEFISQCKNAILSTHNPIIGENAETGQIICDYFAYDRQKNIDTPIWWGLDRIGNKVHNYGMYWERRTEYGTLYEFKPMTWDEMEYLEPDTKTTSNSQPNIHVMCKAKHEKYMEEEEENWEDSNMTGTINDGLCYVDAAGNMVWLNIQDVHLAANDIWNKLKQNEIQNCNANFGCNAEIILQYGTGVDYNNPTCDGLFTDSYDDLLAAQKETASEIDRLLGNLENANIQQQLDEIKSVMIEAGNSFVIGKNEIESTLKKIVSKIGELNQLEEQQIKELDSLVNSLNLNTATTYSSLTEWNERYKYRQDEYKKQLNRAKIAAWTARRAIEFRFGINLSEETTRSLYGDIPSEWADDIYLLGESKCGDEVVEEDGTSTETDTEIDTESDVNGQTKITACLSPEDRIEDYVQKLEDYVASYGNTPGQDWWFHEDDDTGIISIRDHIAVTNVDPIAEVKNLLFFTEEADMTEATFEDTYESITSKFAAPGEELGNGAELPRPSFWQGDATVETATSTTEALGVPSDVHSAHLANDAAIYDDQTGENTAELVKLYSADNPTQAVELFQTIDLNDVETEARVSSNKMEFTASIRKAPMETICASQETYFEELGRCGIACDIEATTPCPYAGQTCVFGGYEDDNSEDTTTAIYMCAWCTADRSCIGEDGTVVQMKLEVEHSEEAVSATKNVPVKRQWTRNRINTLEDAVLREAGEEIGNATVRLTGAETENLVKVSEKIDLSNGWSIGTPGELSTSLIASPEGVEVANYALISGIEGTETTGSVNYTANIDQGAGFYTASFWIKLAEGSAQDTQTENLELLADGTVLIASAQESIDNSWKRVSVTGYDESSIASLRLRIAPEDPSYTGENRIAVWGLQIEKGTQATIYIPTGKNQIPSTTLSTDWSSQSVAVAQVLDCRAPDGHMGTEAHVFSLADNDTATAGYIQYQGTAIGTGKHATFSVWMRAGESAPTEAMIYLTSASAIAAQSENIVSLNSDWQRFDITIEASETVNIGDVTARIYPAGSNPSSIGQVEVWGPQAELNSMATGYQETGTNIAESIVKWNADIGFVGASLSEIGSFGCDELGNPEAGDAPRQCSVPNEEYVRNTYSRKHYSEQYVVENPTDADYPMPSELSVHLSDAERTKLFKAQFTKVEADGDELGYYVFRPFNLDMDQIGSGSMGMFGVLAADNFNYRLRTVAVNMVGTDVINCDNADSPTTCAANNWLIYDFKQMGEVHIRNHHKEESVRAFEIPTGLITGGKAWAAEQVIGYPISGAHQTMLAQLQKVSLMGRPMEGTFELRIYDTPELVWDNVEDIQLILGYHYWTMSE